jgi:hypothetical protein
MEREAFDRANNYRNQSLEQVYNAGNIQQQFGQQLADNATGFNLTANQPVYGQSSAMNTLAAPYFNSGYQQGGQEGRLNSMGRFGALLMQAPQMYNSFQNMQNMQRSQGTPMGWLPNNGAQYNPNGSFNGYGNQFGQHFGRY